MFLKVVSLSQRMIRNQFVILKIGKGKDQAAILPFLYQLETKRR